MPSGSCFLSMNIRCGKPPVFSVRGWNVDLNLPKNLQTKSARVFLRLPLKYYTAEMNSQHGSLSLLILYFHIWGRQCLICSKLQQGMNVFMLGRCMNSETSHSYQIFLPPPPMIKSASTIPKNIQNKKSETGLIKFSLVPSLLLLIWRERRETIFGSIN